VHRLAPGRKPLEPGRFYNCNPGKESKVRGRIKELAKALPDTKVHTIDLGNNGIGAEEVKELAKVLPHTKVYTINLSSNGIGSEGVKS